MRLCYNTSIFIEKGEVTILNKEEFIDKCDTLLNSEMSIENFIKENIEPYILTDDYDAMVTLYGLFLNKEIQIRLSEYRETHKFDSLPECLDMEEGTKLCSNMKKWQKSNEADLNNMQIQFIITVRRYYMNNQKPIPEGMIECISHLGHALIYSGMLNDEAFERDWYVISIMLALAYEEHIEVQTIKEEYINEYKAANHFIKKYNIYLPYYYIAAWDILKINNYYTCNNIEHNRIRLKNIVSEFPDFYRELLSGVPLYSAQKQKSTIEKLMNEKKVYIITRCDKVPFYHYLPSFNKHKSKILKYRNGLKGRFFHPMAMIEVPLTNIYTCTDIKLYLSYIFKEIQVEELNKKIKENESNNYTYDKHEDEAEEKKELTERLNNDSQNVADIVIEFEASKNRREILNTLEEWGVARKTYYDIIKLKNKSIPFKDTLIALAFAMKLSLEQAHKLLYSCGYTLSSAIPRDAIIIEFLEKKERNLVIINNKLYEDNQKIISGKKDKIKSRCKETSLTDVI